MNKTATILFLMSMAFTHAVSATDEIPASQSSFMDAYYKIYGKTVAPVVVAASVVPTPEVKVARRAPAQVSENQVDSNTVFMTSTELENYPLQLDADATTLEIEKMLLGNIGEAVIIGESEKIIPVMRDGVMQFNDSGRVEVKRVKITLLKNSKNKKTKDATEVSALADQSHPVSSQN